MGLDAICKCKQIGVGGAWEPTRVCKTRCPAALQPVSVEVPCSSYTSLFLAWTELTSCKQFEQSFLAQQKGIGERAISDWHIERPKGTHL
eukprot:1161525-Pelagomonas_calceolata.AAC.13